MNFRDEGEAHGAREQQTHCSQQGAGGQAGVLRPREWGLCLGSDPNSERKRTGQGQTAVAEQGTVPMGVWGSRSPAAPNPWVQEGGAKRVGQGRCPWTVGL